MQWRQLLISLDYREKLESDTLTLKPKIRHLCHFHTRLKLKSVTFHLTMFYSLIKVIQSIKYYYCSLAVI